MISENQQQLAQYGADLCKLYEQQARLVGAGGRVPVPGSDHVVDLVGDPPDALVVKLGHPNLFGLSHKKPGCRPVVFMIEVNLDMDELVATAYLLKLGTGARVLEVY